MATRLLQLLAQEYNHSLTHWHTEVYLESASTEAFDVSGERLLLKQHKVTWDEIVIKN